MRKLLLGTLLLATSMGGALAQGTAPAPTAPATLANDLRPTFVAQGPNDRVATKLIGLSIQNGANETIGQIADLVLDEQSTVKAWVVGVGGFLGIGTKYVAIDPSALKLARADETSLKASIDTTKDQLRAAPEYVYLGSTKLGTTGSTDPKAGPGNAATPPASTGTNAPEAK